MMRAVVYEEYGPTSVLTVREVARPIPTPEQVVVRVHATTVNRTDCGFRTGKPFIVRFFSGLRRPKRQILGTEFAGVVDQVGSAVDAFEVGDRVFGVNADRFGAHAEYVCVKQTGPIAVIPDGVTFEQAAATPDGVVLASTCLRWAKVGKGTRLLVYGASGSIGTAAVQLAKQLGAEVTAVCATKDLDLVRSLGASTVIDYTAEDFTKQAASTGDGVYDVVLDAVGKESYRRCRPLLAPRGVYASTDGGYFWQNAALMPLTWLSSKVGTRQAMMPLPRYTQRHIDDLAGLLEAGEYRAVIDRTYPLEQVVEATDYVETEQKVGNVVLVVSTS